jgi:hypothetical protein
MSSQNEAVTRALQARLDSELSELMAQPKKRGRKPSPRSAQRNRKILELLYYADGLGAVIHHSKDKGLKENTAAQKVSELCNLNFDSVVELWQKRDKYKSPFYEKAYQAGLKARQNEAAELSPPE